MPNNQNRGSRDFSRFDNMKDEELEALLRLDAQKTEGEESDLEMLLYVMEVLAERKRNNDSAGKSAQEAFESFKENYMPHTDSDDEENSQQEGIHKSTRKPRRWLRSLSAAAAALAIVLVCSVTANAWGFDIWGTIAKWTQETFHFGSSGQVQASEPEKDDKQGFESLSDALKKKDILLSLAPTWFPEGYEMVNVRVDEMPMLLNVFAMYRNGEQEIKIQIKRYMDADPQQVERNDSFVEAYESDGITYYIFADNKQLRAVWINENYECYISGELTVEEIKSMIDSI